MTRLPLTLRALVLVPLLAAGVDIARATIACGAGAESCLEAAGQGWLGVAGPLLIVAYAVALAFGLAALMRGAATRGMESRAAAGSSGSPRGTSARGFVRTWAIGTLGVAAVCGGQALLAGVLGDATALGGGWPELLAFCPAAGALLALALRVAPAAEELVRDLRPAAPRIVLAAPVASFSGAPLAARPQLRLALAHSGRGPPAPLD